MIITKPDLIAAASVFRSTEKSTPYLHGVSIEPCEKGGAFIVSTDGHRASIGYDADASVEKPILLLADKADWKKFAGRGAAPVTIEGDVSTLGNGDRLFVKDILADGWTFPDWKRIVPRGDLTVTGSCYNAAYLGDFAKIARFLGVRNPAISLNSTGCEIPQIVRVPDRDDWFGIIAPIAADKVPSGLPEWWV